MQCNVIYEAHGSSGGSANLCRIAATYDYDYDYGYVYDYDYDYS